MFIIDDDKTNKLNLPATYGIDDLPVIIQDKKFNNNNSFSYLYSMMDKMMGQTGDSVLVNGVISPTLIAKKSLLRLRILNGSNARIYNLSFNDNRDFYIIGSDGGLLEKSVKVNNLKLAPAERVEILVDVADGKFITLKHIAQNNTTSMGRGMMGRGGMMGNMMGMGLRDKDLNIFTIDATSITNSKKAIPINLVKHDNIAVSSVVRRRIMDLQMQMGPQMMFGGDAFSINNKTMNVSRIDEIVKHDTAEIWVIKNNSSMAHPFHIHNVQFKIIKKSSGIIKGHELGFKDSVLVDVNEQISVIMKFPKFSDKKIPYMYHCHILEHEDRGMMGQFLVV